MAIIYDDNAPRGGRPPIPWERLPANRYYCEHYWNLLYLQFIANNPWAAFAEKAQARHEMPIAERKMAFWKRHPNWSQRAIDPQIAKIKRDWQK